MVAKASNDNLGNKPKNTGGKTNRRKKVGEGTSQEAVAVFNTKLPTIGGDINTISFDKQFTALLMTSRLQKDYATAKNLTTMVKEKQKFPDYNGFLIVALLNQAQLFPYNKEEKPESYEDKKSEDELLRDDIRKQLEKDVSNIPGQGHIIFGHTAIIEKFGQDYQSIITDFAIDTKNLKIIKDCLMTLGTMDITDENRERLEMVYMENILITTDEKIIEECFINFIDQHYSANESFEPGYRPEDNLHKAIVEVTLQYLADPTFQGEKYNKAARNQLWKYNNIFIALPGVLDKIGEKVAEEHDFDELNRILYDDYKKNNVKEVFSKILVQASDLNEITNQLYTSLLAIVKSKTKEGEPGEDLPF